MRAVGFFAVLALSAEVTPVQQVINLMNGMLEKGKKEKHEEQVQMAAYSQFCGDTSEEKAAAIKSANQQIESLKASINKQDAKAERLQEEITALEADIATFTGDVKAATAVRGQNKADYDTTHTDYSESISALGRAIQVLKKQNFDRPQADLLQLTKMDMIPPSAKDVVTKFLQQAPQANGYEFQSGGVIEMLEGLLDKFVDERTGLEKAEANSVHAFKMLEQDLTSQIATAEDTSAAKRESMASAKQAAAAARGDLTDTTATRDDDAAYKSDLDATCAQKSTDFEARQKLREEEIDAINQAIEIISSGAVAGSADKHLPAMTQTSLMQIAADAESPAVKRTLTYLAQSGERLHSKLLMQVAIKATGPFDKVKKMIQQMIVKLMEEANEEAEQKGFCDTELAKNAATRKEKTTAVETLHAKIDELTAHIAKLTQQIADLTTGVSNLDKAVAEATELRNTSEAKNKQTIADAKAAQSAVARALVVLKDFYAKSGTATAFAQQQPEAPEIFDSSYQGMQSENGGVVGMLEVIESDFARLEAETEASNTEEQKAYDTFMSDSAVDKAQKSKDIEHKTAKKASNKEALSQAKQDLEANQKELDAALDTFDKLKPTCVDAGVSHEDRVARRQEEVQSLQEALKILSGEELA